ncbi:hypothetical protein M3231_11430 [Neobacillus mesonae]|nr:hypothetical protein [Neobacillus mesonae]
MFNRGDSDSGAVTIFLAMVLAVVFLFVAVFIDYARIGAMKVQAERLAHAAMRSVMSSYIPELQEGYGLFAHEGEKGDYVLAKVLNDSTKPTPHKDGFPLIGMGVDSSGLVFERELGKYENFNHQIQEEMKYKAPIDFMIEAVSRFKPLSAEMKQAAHTVDVLRKLQKLYDKRERLLEEAIQKRREAAKTASALAKLVMDPPSTYFSDSPLGGAIRSAADAAAKYSDYYSKYTEDEAREPMDRMYTFELSDYRSDVNRMVTAINRENREALAKNQQLLNEADVLILDAKQLNEQMKQVIKDGETRAANQAYDKVGQAKTPGTASSSSGAGNFGDELRKQTEALVRKEAEFAEFTKSHNKQLSDFREANQLISSAANSISQLNNGEVYGKRQSVLAGSRQIQQYINLYVTSGSGNLIDQASKQIDDYRAADKERAKVDKQSQQKIAEAQNRIKLLVATAGLEKAAEQFNKLEQYYEENLSFNQATAEDPYVNELESDTYDAGGEAMADMDQLFGGMSGLLDVVSNELFQNEYALHYFKSVNLSMIAGSKTDNSTLSPETFFLPGSQELEYIIYGFHNPYGNIVAAYTEVFTLRLAIRTMEGLIENSKLGNPLLVLSKAILHGLTEALADMQKLADEGKVELSKYAKQISITYRDHLRLFLLAHSNNEKKMSRMIAMIRLNTEIDLNKTYTYAAGQIEMSMRLWFLPGLMRAASAVAGSSDRIEEGRITVSLKSDYAY